MSITTRTRVKDLLRSEAAEDVLGEYGLFPSRAEYGLSLERLCRLYGVNVWELKADLVEALASQDEEWEVLSHHGAEDDEDDLDDDSDGEEDPYDDEDWDVDEDEEPEQDPDDPVWN